MAVVLAPIENTPFGNPTVNGMVYINGSGLQKTDGPTYGTANTGIEITSAAAGTVGFRVLGASTPSADMSQWVPNGVTAGERARITQAGCFSNNQGHTSTEVFGLDATAARDFVTIMGKGSTNTNSDQATAFGSTNIVNAIRASILGYRNTIANGHSGSIVLGSFMSTTAGGQFIVAAAAFPITDWYSGKGITHATPVAYTIHGTGGLGTDIDGATIFLGGGKSTGAGNSGDVVVQHAPSSGTGSSLNSLVNVLTIGDSSVALGNTSEGGVGKLTYRSTHETHTLSLATTSDTTTISIPSGARLKAVLMNVDTAVTDDGGDDTWSAAFITGSTTTIVTGAAASQNTKVNFPVPDELTSAVTQIQFTPNGGSFSAGVIEIVAFYEDTTNLANA